MIVTTAHKSNDATMVRAKQLADKIQGLYVPRNKRSLASLRANWKQSDILLVLEHELKFYKDENDPLFFHPSTALLRVKRLLAGEIDTLIEVSKVTEGDKVLDCTAGLASDAIVFSYVAGDKGEVIALEDEKVIALIVSEGLKNYKTNITVLEQAMRQVQLVQADHLQYLCQLDDQSVDIVYFDPMFVQTVDDSASMRPLRSIAEKKPLQLETIHEALRVARKSVVMKERSDSSEFQRLGFKNVRSSYSKIAYGVIER